MFGKKTDRTNQRREELLASYRAEIEQLLPHLDVDLEALDEAARVASRNQNEHQYSGAFANETTHRQSPELSRIYSEAAGMAREKRAARDQAKRRISELRAFVDCDVNAIAAEKELTAIRTEGEEAEKALQQIAGTVRRVSGDLEKLEGKVQARIDSAAERALRGESLSVEHDSTASEIALLRSALTGLGQRRDALLQSLPPIAERAANTRQALLRARAASARLDWLAAMTEIRPIALNMVAANQAARGLGDSSTTVVIGDNEVWTEAQRLEHAVVAWRPRLADVDDAPVAEAVQVDDTASVVVDVEQRAA